MTSDQVTLLVLGSLIVFTNIYWAIVVHRLINKVMSRDFTEFRSAEVKAPTQAQRPEQVPAGQIEDLRILQDIGF